MTEKERKKLVEKLEKFIPVLKKAGKVAGLYALLNFCAPSSQAQTHSLSDKDPTLTTITHSAPTERVHYQVDTMARGEKRALGSHCASKNTITVNHSRTDKDFNRRSHSIETLIHEHQHQNAALKGAYDYPVSLEQAYKRDRHDEIAANIAVLLYKRDIYIRTGNLNVFDGFFTFYKDQIVAGVINPKSNKIEDFEKDMSIIVNMSQIMWEVDYGRQENYHRQHINNAGKYSDLNGKYKNFWDENYKRSLKIFYNIGGIDFTRFMEKDVEIPQEDLVKLQKISAKYPQTATLATTNYPVNRSKIAHEEETQYPKWSPENRVSPIQYADVPVPIIQVPEGYLNEPVITEATPQQKEVVVENSSQKKKGKGKEGWNKFWGKVGDFFRPSWKQKPNTETTVTTSNTAKPAQAPVAKPAPAKTPTMPQKPTAVQTPTQTPNVVDTMAQTKVDTTENVSTSESKPTFKEKMNKFGEKLGDFFRPSWKQKPEEKTSTTSPNTVSSEQSPSVTNAPEPEQTPTAKPVSAKPSNEVKTTSDTTSSVTAPKTNEQNQNFSRISPTKSKIKINKLRTVKSKEKASKTQHASVKRPERKMLQEIEKIKQEKSANNN